MAKTVTYSVVPRKNLNDPESAPRHYAQAVTSPSARWRNVIVHRDTRRYQDGAYRVGRYHQGYRRARSSESETSERSRSG